VPVCTPVCLCRCQSGDLCVAVAVTEAGPKAVGLSVCLCACVSVSVSLCQSEEHIDMPYKHVSQNVLTSLIYTESRLHPLYIQRVGFVLVFFDKSHTFRPCGTMGPGKPPGQIFIFMCLWVDRGPCEGSRAFCADSMYM
jgi:hypothetical protein